MMKFLFGAALVAAAVVAGMAAFRPGEDSVDAQLAKVRRHLPLRIADEANLVEVYRTGDTVTAVMRALVPLPPSVSLTESQRSQICQAKQVAGAFVRPSEVAEFRHLMMTMSIVMHLKDMAGRTVLTVRCDH